MRNRSLLFTLAISTIVVACGLALSAASITSAQRVTGDSFEMPVRVQPQNWPDFPVDWRMRELERRVRVDVILYQGPFGQSVGLPERCIPAVAVTVHRAR
jgi:hypothetical protein